MHSSYLIALATQGLLASALPYMLKFVTVVVCFIVDITDRSVVTSILSISSAVTTLLPRRVSILARKTSHGATLIPRRPFATSLARSVHRDLMGATTRTRVHARSRPSSTKPTGRPSSTALSHSPHTLLGLQVIRLRTGSTVWPDP